MTAFFAVTFRGLEQIAASEIARIPGAAISQQIYRQVHFDLQTNFQSLLQLRTVDDLFVAVPQWQPVTRQRASLDLIAEKAAAMPLDAIVDVIGSVRELSSTPIFSVTANFVGKRNYTSAEIKQRVADAIEGERRWQYTANDLEADLNIRLFIAGETAEVGARLAKRPLHNRDFAPTDYPGSLKPPLAAGLVRFAEPRSHQLLLDPFSGSGTIVLESLHLGLQAVGGDISSRAVAACRNRNLDISQWDARSLPLEASSVDRIVSNLPWGDQSPIQTDSAGFYRDVCRELERVLAPKGKIVLLTTVSEQVQFSSLRLEMNNEVSLFGKRPAILKFGEISP
jgi:tRNA (guanine6-N2)-methyltransferase